MKRYSEMHPVNVIVRPLLIGGALASVFTLGHCNGRASMLNELAKGQGVSCEGKGIRGGLIAGVPARYLSGWSSLKEGASICR